MRGGRAHYPLQMGRSSLGALEITANSSTSKKKTRDLNPGGKGMPKILANAQQGAGRAGQSRWGPLCSLLTPSPLTPSPSTCGSVLTSSVFAEDGSFSRAFTNSRESKQAKGLGTATALP